jgi:photosystem II stability/assembly factor-like uncharacterized protein
MNNKILTKIVLVISLFIVTAECNAQWVLTNRPQGVNILGIYSFAVDGETVYAGSDTSTLADHGGAVFVSTNSGMDWINSSTGIEGGEVRALTLSGDEVFAGTYGGGVFISTDSGANWTGVNNGLTSLFVWTLAISDSNIFAGTYGAGVFISSDNGTNWVGVNNGLTNLNILSLVVSDTNIFAGTEEGIFRSTDDGNNWTRIDDSSINSQYGEFKCMAVTGSHIFVGSIGGLFHSPDNGTNWSNVSSGLPYPWVMDIEIFNANVFALTNWGNISLSTDYGTSWSIINKGVIDTIISAFTVSDPYLFADAGYGNGIMRCALSSILTGIYEKEGAGLLPSDIKLIQNYPNPFNLTTTIQFNLPKSSFVSLKVYDCFGRELNTLVNKFVVAGMHSVIFEANNLSSGLYIYKFQAGDLVEIRKMVIRR